jgi:polysaccharide export outer membrane protein
LRLSNGRYRQEGVPDESIGENRPGNRSLGRAVPAGLRELDEGEQVHGRKLPCDQAPRAIKIDKSGRIMFPLVGDVQVADRTVYDVRDELQARLAKYIVSPQVFIYASTIQSQKVLVLGEVKTPGILTLDVDLLITDAVMKAGGPTNDAKTSDIYVIRRDSGKSDAAGKTALVKFDMKNAIHSGDFSNNVQLRNGDIVYVPTQAISDVSRFMAHIAAIIGPIVTTESGIVLWPQVIDVFQGKKPTNTNINVSP